MTEEKKMPKPMYVGPDIDIPLRTLQFLYFVAVGNHLQDDWLIIKNRYDGKTGVHSRAVVAEYQRRLLLVE